MKWLRYNIRTVEYNGVDEEGNPIGREVLDTVEVQDNEVGRTLAEWEAVGEIVPFDDGQPEAYQPTESERLEALEAALLEMMGVSV